MVGNKIIAAIRSDGKVYPLDDDEGVGASGGSVLNTSHGQIANIFNLKLRVNSSTSQNMNDSSEIIMNNNRIQASVMDLGKKLLQCARDNDINGVETMMRKGAPFASDWLGMTALHFAAMNDRYDICKLLLTSGGNKDARTKVDRTPLHLAAFYGHERIAQLLIEFQSALNPRDMLRMTPLHWAVEKRHKSIVRLLLKHNADVTAISKFGKTPIALAVLTEQPDILQELEIARQIQKSKKYNEQHEKETNEAVNSIIGGVKDDDEPVNKKSRMCSESEKLIKNSLGLSPDHFADTTDSKDLDNSAINLLKSHGISMMKDDEDTSNNLLTTALQNGRQLVLSEGGRLLLNEAKRMGADKIANSLKTPMSSHLNAVTQVKAKTEIEPSPVQSVTRYRQNIVAKLRDAAKKEVLSASDVTTNNNNEKQYKNIRIISLNDFKKMYGNGNMKTLQKIDATSNKSQIIKIKGDDKKIYMHKKSPEQSHIIHPDDLGIIEDDDDGELPPNIVKVSPESDQEETSDIETHQTAIIHPPTQQQTVEQRLLPVRHQSVPYNSRITYSRSPSVASVGEVKSERTPVIPLLTIPEICRQLLELRKQNDELRRKYEIAQKEKEDFRNRLEKLETFLLLEHTEEDYSEM